MEVAEIIEGTTMLFVPKVSLGSAEPPTVPAFFNPAASRNRDITVAVVAATRGKSLCDALAGVGARGLRVANEIRRRVAITFLEINPDSMALARRSARANGVQDRCSFVGKDANAYLWSRGRTNERFDYVDIDPFGSPAPYLQGAFNAVEDGGIVSVTATDTAVLCGVYPKVARRRYWATPLNNSFHHETAARILVDACRKVAGSLDIGVQPVLVHCTRHYIRVFVRATVGASRADQAAEGEGYVVYCPKCGETSASREQRVACRSCGAKAKCAGPLWSSSLIDAEMFPRVLRHLGDRKLTEALGILEPLADVDKFPPYSYSLEDICSRLRVPSVPPRLVRDSLEKRGFRTGVQPFERTGLKTDARFQEVVSAVKEESRTVGKVRSPSRDGQRLGESGTRQEDRSS